GHGHGALRPDAAACASTDCRDLGDGLLCTATCTPGTEAACPPGSFCRALSCGEGACAPGEAPGAADDRGAAPDAATPEPDAGTGEPEPDPGDGGSSGCRC